MPVEIKRSATKVSKSEPLVNLKVRREMLKRIKVYAADEGLPMSDVANQLIDDHIPVRPSSA